MIFRGFMDLKANKLGKTNLDLENGVKFREEYTRELIFFEKDNFSNFSALNMVF